MFQEFKEQEISGDMPEDCRKDLGLPWRIDVMRQGLRNGIPGEGNSQKKGNKVTMGMGWLTGVTRHEG